MKLLNRCIPAIFAALAFMTMSAASHADSCVNCHRDHNFKVTNKKLYDYYQNWNGSAHDLAAVYCTTCHGGDSNTGDKKAAHAGIHSASDERSPIHFKNIPSTCGKCHPAIQKHFSESKHFKLLAEKGIGPNCVTCHNSMNSKADYRPMIAQACSDCHSKKTGNNPQVVKEAVVIMQRLTHAEGYRTWAEFYYDSIGKPQEMNDVRALFKGIAQDLHEFDFKNLDQESVKLLADLKALFRKIKLEKKEKDRR